MLCYVHMMFCVILYTLLCVADLVYSSIPVAIQRKNHYYKKTIIKEVLYQ